VRQGRSRLSRKNSRSVSWIEIFERDSHKDIRERRKRKTVERRGSLLPSSPRNCPRQWSIEERSRRRVTNSRVRMRDSRLTSEYVSSTSLPRNHAAPRDVVIGYLRSKSSEPVDLVLHANARVSFVYDSYISSIFLVSEQKSSTRNSNSFRGVNRSH